MVNAPIMLALIAHVSAWAICLFMVIEFRDIERLWGLGVPMALTGIALLEVKSATSRKEGASVIHKGAATLLAGLSLLAIASIGILALPLALLLFLAAALMER